MSPGEPENLTVGPQRSGRPQSNQAAPKQGIHLRPWVDHVRPRGGYSVTGEQHKGRYRYYRCAQVQYRDHPAPVAWVPESAIRGQILGLLDKLALPEEVYHWSMDYLQGLASQDKADADKEQWSLRQREGQVRKALDGLLMKAAQVEGDLSEGSLRPARQKQEELDLLHRRIEETRAGRRRTGGEGSRTRARPFANTPCGPWGPEAQCGRCGAFELATRWRNSLWGLQVAVPDPRRERQPFHQLGGTGRFWNCRRPECEHLTCAYLYLTGCGYNICTASSGLAVSQSAVRQYGDMAQQAGNWEALNRPRRESPPGKQSLPSNGSAFQWNRQVWPRSARITTCALCGTIARGGEGQACHPGAKATRKTEP